MPRSNLGQDRAYSNFAIFHSQKQYISVKILRLHLALKYFLSIHRIIWFLKISKYKYFKMFGCNKYCSFKTEVLSKIVVFFEVFEKEV
jgi:hypothetical protein